MERHEAHSHAVEILEDEDQEGNQENNADSNGRPGCADPGPRDGRRRWGGRRSRLPRLLSSGLYASARLRSLMIRRFMVLVPARSDRHIYVLCLGF